MKISFITIPVYSLEESVSFYKDNLDFTVERSFSPAENIHITFLSDGSGGKIELIEFKGHSPNNEAELSIGFEVEDIQAVFNRLKAASVDIPEEPHSISNGVTLMQAKDPNGVRLGFVQQK